MAVYSGGSSGVWLIPRMSAVIHAADQTTDVAATILRMLYIKDLRGLQTIVDETLVNVQVCAPASLALSHRNALLVHTSHVRVPQRQHVPLQNYTANPKTDAALGRIGR